MKNHVIINVFLTFLLAIPLFILSGCDPELTSNEADKNLSVKMNSPLDNYVVGDSVLLKVELQNVNAVVEVQYYIDGSSVATVGISNDFQFLWTPISPTLGKVYKLFSKAKDKAGKIITSDTISVHYKWMELISDPNQSWQPNINKIYARSNNSNLEFRMESFGTWGDPTNINQGISFGIFLDTDQNSSTGLRPNLNFHYNVNDVGADYLIVAGLEGNALYKWNQLDTSWEMHASLAALNLPNNNSYLEMGIVRSEIGNPQKIDIVGLLLTTITNSESKMDWCPDQGHLTYKIDGSFMGNPLNKLSSSKKFEKRIFILKKMMEE